MHFARCKYLSLLPSVYWENNFDGCINFSFQTCKMTLLLCSLKFEVWTLELGSELIHGNIIDTTKHQKFQR